VLGADSGFFYYDASALELGAVDFMDVFQIEFYAASAGTIDLASATNANYETCEQCVLMYVDGDNDTPRIFYQSAGTMTLDATSDVDNGVIKAGFTGLHLVEVTIDASTFVSTPVVGGACIDVTVTSDLEAAPL